MFKQLDKQARFPELVKFVQSETEVNSLYGNTVFGTGTK